MEAVSIFGENACVVAQGTGRLRIQVPRLYRSQYEKRRIEEGISQHAAIDAVYANPLTGKVLILFHCSVPVERVLVMLGVAKSSTAQISVPASSRRRPETTQRVFARKNTAHLQIARSQDIYPAWHMQEAEVALAFHGSSAQSGLPAVIAEDRMRRGRNALPQPQPRSAVNILLGQFASLPVLLLSASALLSLLTGGLWEAIAIGAVLTLNAGIGFATERRAESTIASLSELVDDIVPVVRSGKLQEIHASSVVEGDLLVLLPGVRIAADARLVRADGITFDESVLTGESRPVSKSSAALMRDAPLAERFNMAYSGTAVSAGTGLAVVVGTGRRTEIGVVQTLMERTERPKTPMQKQLDHLGNQLVAGSVGICACVFAIGLLRGFGWLPMLKASISLAIAAVPEGLPTVATTSLARTIRLMRTRHMLVRHLQAVETLGAIQTICLDKTGTLTMNRMSVVEVRLNGSSYEVKNGVLHGHGKLLETDDDQAWSRLLQICVLCSEEEIRSNGEVSAINVSATESALLELATSAGYSIKAIRERHALLNFTLRADDRRYMATARSLPDSHQYLIAAKGSPVEVLALCNACLLGDRIVPLTAQRKAALLKMNESMAEKQLRVLGFAFGESSSADVRSIAGKLIWVGLTGLADPLRIGAERVIADLHRARIRTVMLTGDQRSTALAIGSSLKLNNHGDLRIVESNELSGIESPSLKAQVAQADVFARISPGRKLEIVSGLRENGEVVAMTGDGINDGPALQAADVGIAMGLHGTNLARSAADVVLEDDRLETILDAIREGRTLTTNIRKSLHFLVSSNMSEILVVLGAISAGAPSPLSPMQLLWVNLLGDVLPAIALAAEPAESDVMQLPPRDSAKPIIGREELMLYARESACLSGGTLAAYGYGLLRYGPGTRAGTIAFNALMLGQLLHALSCRSDQGRIFSAEFAHTRNSLNLAVAGSIGLQVLANLVPALRGLLGIERIGVMDIATTFAGAGIPLVLNETLKSRKVKVNPDADPWTAPAAS